MWNHDGDVKRNQTESLINQRNYTRVLLDPTSQTQLNQ